MDEIEIPTLAQDIEFLPAYASQLAAGADVRACIREPIVLEPGEAALIPTGLRIAIPEGYEIQVRPRSGLALKEQVTVLNTPGTIDADYRGDIGIILINHGKKPFLVLPKMRVAQLVLAKIERARFSIEEALVATARGEGGFGHTGTH